MNGLVRPLQLTDAPAIGSLHVETWLDTYRGLIPDKQLDGLDPVRSTERWRQSLAQTQTPSRVYNVGAFRQDELLGFAGAGEARDKWGYDCELWAINIPKRFQKQGVGKALLKACVAHVLSLNAQNMYLYCLIGNDNAMQFYRHLGAVDSDRIQTSDGYQERALVWDDLQALSRLLSE